MQRILSIILLLCGLSMAVYAQPVDTLSGHITTDDTLFATTLYYLDGFVYVDSLASLTIEPGTIIMGIQDSKGSLIVQRGGKIHAVGTSTKPIIFTSQHPPGLRAAGDWGGVIILGNATINVPGGDAEIEGGVGSHYGGSDDNDNSGEFSYVRIEFPGIAFSPNNEINGLTMGGVGDGTQIDHVQVSYSGDDSFEWFGGTVNCKNLIAFASLDDDFDTDFGFRGKLQHLFAIKDPNVADISASNGFESDNNGGGTFDTPRTSPWFSNVTMVGPQSDTGAAVNPLHGRGAHLRRSTLTSIYNSIFVGFKQGLYLDGAGVAGAATGDTLQVRNSIWAGFHLSGQDIYDNDGVFDAAAWFYSGSYANQSFVTKDSLGLIDPFTLVSPDPRPAVGSPADGAADFSNTRLTDPFFDVTTYIGAFDPALPRDRQWDAEWSEYNPQKYHVPSPFVVLSGNISSDMTLDHTKRYLLTGFVYVDSLVTLTIEPGTVIYGDKDSKGSLIVSRGAMIMARGTPSAPIIFTSAQPVGERAAGDWGGVVILGNATINVPGGDAEIEGGVGSHYGGSDDADNSGVFSYVRIEFPGIALAPNNEINGLTMGGVGSGTQIDHVQVSYSGDDAFEWFGGTVNCKYLIAYKSLDDDFDTDFGFRGKLQFCFAQKDSSIADISASNGFESDNNGGGTFDTPRTSPWFSNVTMVGPQPDTGAAVNPLHGRGAHLRRSTLTSIYNSVFVGFKQGLYLDGAGVAGAATGDTLQVRNSIWAGLHLAGQDIYDNDGVFDAGTWYYTGSYGNRSYIRVDSVGLIDAWNYDYPDPRPAPGTPAASGADFTNTRLTDPFYDVTTYVGAFDPDLPREYQWDYPWANYHPEYFNPVVHSFTLSSEDGWNLISVPVEHLTDSAFTTLFPSAVSSAFAYDAGYVATANASAGSGYWLKFSGAGSYVVPNGNLVLEATIPVQEKWNMIGSLGTSIPTVNVQTDPPGNIVSSIFAYNPGSGYSTVSTLEPGQGHWVKTAASGTLTMSADAVAPAKAFPGLVDFEAMNSVTITDAAGRSQTLYFGATPAKANLGLYELPPAAPGSNFDARFLSQRMVEHIDGDHGSVEMVVSSAVFPLTVTMVQNPTGSGYAITAPNSKGENIVRELSSGNPVVLTEVAGGRLGLVVTGGSGSTLPAMFALGRSYPNPFNPETHFTVDVPRSAVVEIGVYNILGQKVTTLFTGVRDAGSSRMSWNGLSASGTVAPSGIYFIRMSSPEAGFSAMQKVIFLR